MPLLSKLLIDQKNIFLAPGDYFHSEFIGMHYHQLPPLLQKQQNSRLIKQYQLGLPNENTPILPKVLADNWSQIPAIAWGLGVIQHASPLPWWGELTQYHQLHKQFTHPLWQSQTRQIETPQQLLALGAEQLLTCLTTFSHCYATRAKYMFSRSTQKVINHSVSVLLPWNIIEETCHYVREHTA
ncbi:TPA: hypothetical protein ACS7XC_003451 [Providencia alcalifaciens]